MNSLPVGWRVGYPLMAMNELIGDLVAAHCNQEGSDLDLVHRDYKDGLLLLLREQD